MEGFLREVFYTFNYCSYLAENYLFGYLGSDYLKRKARCNGLSLDFSYNLLVVVGDGVKVIMSFTFLLYMMGLTVSRFL